MKHFVKLFISLFMLAAPLFASHAHAHGVTLKVHHYLPADSPFHTQFLLPWLTKLENESHGLLRFQIFPTMQMGGTPAKLYDQVKSGSVDIVWTALESPSERFPAFSVFNLPLTMKSSQGSSRALWEYVQAQDLTRSEFKGVRLLAVNASAELSVLVMNSGVYKSLSEELRHVIMANSGAEISAWLGKITDAAGDKLRQRVTSDSTKTAIDEKIKQLDALGLNGKELIDSAQALIAEYDSKK